MRHAGDSSAESHSMTLSIAWVRKIGPTPELIFASDSRLTGGGNVDHCQKVFSLPREDCCISFAGSTFIAYPVIMQLQNTIVEYKKLLDRAMDVDSLKGKFLHC
jgi:ATP-dependent protease HslVU (ClpYQ) peptidase subunit